MNVGSQRNSYNDLFGHRQKIDDLEIRCQHLAVTHPLTGQMIDLIDATLNEAEAAKTP